MRRSCEIEVSSAARSRSVSAATRASVDVLGERDALDRERGLVGQRIEQPALVGREQRPGPSRSMPTTPTAPRPVRIGRNSRLRARQRVGAAPGRRGRAPSTSRPPRDRPRRARPPADSRRAPRRSSPSGSRSTTSHLQHRARSGSAVAHSRSSSVADAGELAAEAVELLGGCARALRARRSPARATRAVEVAGDDRDDQRRRTARRRSPDRRS